jgi:hypothetical protein
MSKPHYWIIPATENAPQQVLHVKNATPAIKRRVLSAMKRAKLSDIDEQTSTLKGGGYLFTISNEHTPIAVKVTRKK